MGLRHTSSLVQSSIDRLAFALSAYRRYTGDSNFTDMSAHLARALYYFPGDEDGDLAFEAGIFLLKFTVFIGRCFRRYN